MVYTQKTGEYYEDLGEDWTPESFHSSTSDTDDFDSANKLEYRVCGYDITVSDDNKSLKPVSYSYLLNLKEAFRGNAETMQNMIRKRLTTSFPIVFRSHLESEVDDIIESVITASGYLIDDILAE